MYRKTTSRSQYAGLFILLCCISLLFMVSCEETTGPESGGSASNYRISITAEESSIAANGGTTRIFVKVYTGSDTTNAVSGVSVNITATLNGNSFPVTIDNSLTNAQGIAQARIFGGTLAGTVAVTASIQVTAKERISDTEFVTIIPGTGLVSADPLEILANGISQSVISATVVDTFGQPVAGAQVEFSTTRGTISASAFTDTNGNATAILTSEPSAIDLFATVTASSNAGKVALSEGSGAAKTAQTEANLGTVTVALKGITITGTEEKDIILANGADSTYIYIHVKETTSGVPVPNAVLKLSTEFGTLQVTDAITDNEGNASVLLHGGAVAGEGNFIATLAPTLVYTKQLTFVKEITMILTSSPSVLSANGKDTSEINASIRDVDGNPLEDVMVYFTTSDGVILASSETDQWGAATVLLRSSRHNAVAEVTARYGLIEKKTEVQFTGTNITLQATPLVLVADGEKKSKITVTVNDASGTPIVDDPVTLTTSIGTLETIDGEIIGSTFIDSTTAEGKITAYISSNTSGDALLTASMYGAQDTLSLDFTNYVFSLAPQDQNILAGGDTTYVTATLKEINDTVVPITAGNITFSTTLGRIGSETVNQDGTYTVQLISGTSAGIATVSASIKQPKVTSSTSVYFNAADVDSISITYDRPTVRLGGGEAIIEATVFDKTGNPKEGETVTFSILKSPGGGERIEPGTAITDERGLARVSFITGNRGSERDGVEIQAKIGSVESNLLNLTISGEPRYIQAGYAENYTEENDGTFSLEITTIVSDVNRNEVVDGTLVNLSLEGDAGVIPGQIPTISGVATTKLLYSPSDAGKEVTLTVTSSGASDQINIPLPGFKPDFITVVASPSSVPADGKSEITISVTLFDDAGSSENVPDGTMVAFSTLGGTLDPSVARTENGVATTILRSDKNVGEIVVTAQSGDKKEVVEVAFEEVGSIVNEVSGIELRVDDTELLANGIESTYIYATLKRHDGTIITVPTTVLFETDLGEVTQSVLSDSTTGTAIAQFSSNKVGTAHIKASVGEVFDYIDVFLVPGPPLSINLEFEPNSVGVQGSGRNVSLLVKANVLDEKNNAVQDSNLVKFELVGSADPDASLSSPTPGNTHISEPVPTINGTASVSFTAGKRSGTVRIRATVVDEDGIATLPLVTSETTEILVHSGPPYLDMTDLDDPFSESRITISGGPLNIFAGELNTEFSKSSVGILIGDKYKNPVPGGTAVWFTTTGGIITTSTAYTEQAPPEIDIITASEAYTEIYEGITYVTLYAGNPFPTVTNSQYLANPNVASHGGPASFDVVAHLMSKGYGDFDNDGDFNDGIAIVSAYTLGLDEDEDQVVVWNYVPIVFSLQVHDFTVDPNLLSLGVGETSHITITIQDVNGNPVVGGSVIQINSQYGSLSTREIETPSPGRTEYVVTLTNNLNILNDVAVDTVVSVQLESPNGNYTAISPPIRLTLDAP